jgi:hypothetical protein
MSDPPLERCPDCDGPLRKLLVPPKVATEGKEEPEAPAPDRTADLFSAVHVPWNPTKTDIHKGWKQRRKWKRDAIAASKRRERQRQRDQRGEDDD